MWCKISSCSCHRTHHKSYSFNFFNSFQLSSLEIKLQSYAHSGLEHYFSTLILYIISAPAGDALTPVGFFPVVGVCDGGDSRERGKVTSLQQEHVLSCFTMCIKI